MNIEAAIKVAAGPVTGYMTDAAGSFLISPEKKAEMGLVDKSLVDLFWKTPMQSATVQSQKTLRGETAGKIYNLSDSITKDINDLTKKANHLLYINGAKTPEELSPADLTKFNDLRNQFAIKKPQLDELKIVKNAMSVMSDFEVRGKSIPLSFKNSLNAYALAISSGNLNNVTQADIDEIHRIAGLKTSINKIDWSAIK